MESGRETGNVSKTASCLLSMVRGRLHKHRLLRPLCLCPVSEVDSILLSRKKSISLNGPQETRDIHPQWAPKLLYNVPFKRFPQSNLGDVLLGLETFPPQKIQRSNSKAAHQKGLMSGLELQGQPQIQSPGSCAHLKEEI